MTFTNSWEENINPEIEDMAIIIIIIGETMPALTAASPNIKPPNIDTEEALVEDILISNLQHLNFKLN